MVALCVRLTMEKGSRGTDKDGSRVNSPLHHSEFDPSQRDPQCRVAGIQSFEDFSAGEILRGSALLFCRTGETVICSCLHRKSKTGFARCMCIVAKVFSFTGSL